MNCFESNTCAIVIALTSACAVIGCGGGSDAPTSDQPTPTPTPTGIVVQRTSLENASLPNIPRAKFDTVTPALAMGFGHTSAFAFADFKRNDQFQMVAATIRLPWPTNAVGKIEFYEQSNGKWTNITTTLLDDNTGCVQSSGAIIADFNGDKKPDVFIPCFGLDAHPFPGEFSRVLMSTPSGKYTNTTVPVGAIAHSASAADHTGDGFADIAVASLGGVTNTPSFILRNNRNGTFTPDYDGIRVNSSQSGVTIASVLYADINKDGAYDLIATANDVADKHGYIFRNRIYYGTSNGNVSTTPTYIPVLPHVGPNSTIVLQTLVRAGTVFFLRTANDADQYYKGTFIDCYNTRTNVVHNFYNEAKRPTTTYNGNWTDLINFSGNSIVSSNETFQVTAPIPAPCM